jgi:hypothetical protein
VNTNTIKCLSLAAACAALLAGCASGPSRPVARQPLRVAPGQAPFRQTEAAPPSRDLVAEAGAFESFMRRARAIDAGFSNAGDVAQAVQTGASHTPAELESGMVAYAALAALQEPQFVAAVRAQRDRGQLAQRLTADPRVALGLPGAEAAAALASGALHAQGQALAAEGQKVKRASYSVQRQAWSQDKPADPAGQLARVKRLGFAGYQAERGDGSHLAEALAQGGRRGGAASPVVTRGVALAALSVIGEEGRGRSLMSEPRTAMCLRLAKLNYHQCLASAGPQYEDIYCLGQHAMIDPGQCVVEAAQPPTGRMASVTRASYRR